MTPHRTCELSSVVVLLLTIVIAATAQAQSSMDSINRAIVDGDFDTALELIERELGNHQGDPALRLKRAEVYSYSGQQNVALQELDSLRIEYPGNVDYALARGRLLGQMQQDEEALHELRIATGLAPSYEEVWQLRFDILSRQSDLEAQAAHETLRREAAARFPNSKWLREQQIGEETQWTVLLSASHEDLDNDLPNWSHQFVELTRETEDDLRLGFRFGRDVRNDTADVTLGLNAEFEWSSGWFGGTDLGLSGDPDFQPETAFSGHVGRPLGDGWVADLRYRRRDYPTAAVDSVIGTIEKYYGDFRFAYSPGLSRLAGSSSFMNHVMTVNWFYNEDSNVGITMSTGKEAESIGIGQVLETDVNGIVISGRQRLNERFGLQWWLGSHEQGDFYRRRFLGLAVSFRI